VIHVQAILFVRVANQDLLYKVIVATIAPQELSPMAQLVQHVPVLVTHAQAALFVKLASQDMVYKAINAAPVPQIVI